MRLWGGGGSGLEPYTFEKDRKATADQSVGSIDVHRSQASTHRQSRLPDGWP